MTTAASTIEAPAAAAPGGEAEQSLPVDIRTILVGMRRRMPLALAIAALSIVAGMLGGRAIGDHVYESSTVLLYKPPQGAGPESDGNEAPSLRTLVNLVEIRANFEETRTRLKLQTTIETLAKAVTVEVPENSQLLIIKAQWDTAATAAALANGIRNVFFEHQRSVRRQEAQSKLRDLEARLERVRQQLLDADNALKQFTVKNHVVDLNKEADWYLQQLISVELSREQADGESQSLQLQQGKLSGIVGDLRSKLAAEEREIAAGADQRPAGSTSEELRNGRTAMLRAKEVELTRARALRDNGLLAEVEYEKAEAAYEAERYAVYTNSPNTALLKEMTAKELTIRLEGIAQQQKFAHLNDAVNRVSSRLQKLPLVQREYVALSRDVTVRAQERDRIEQFLALARRHNESESFDFAVVSDATTPLLPVQSNRKIVFVAISALGSAAGLMLVVGLEFADRRVRSLAQLSLALKLPAIAELRAGALRQGGQRDVFVRTAQRIRSSLSGQGAMLLVASATAGEGATAVARHLAAVLGERGERVLLVDARLEIDTFGPAMAGADGLTAGMPALADRAGLGDYLRGSAGLASVAHPAGIPGVDIVPATGSPTAAQLASPRMRELLGQASAQYGFVIIDTSPVIASADAILLAESAHASLLVVQAERRSVATLATAVERLSAAGPPLLGCLLTEVHADFLERVGE